jgi:hypothetical protein
MQHLERSGTPVLYIGRTVNCTAITLLVRTVPATTYRGTSFSTVLWDTMSQLFPTPDYLYNCG